MLDPHTRESRGFGFVYMAEANGADTALEGLNGFELNERAISVEKVRE